VRGWLLEDRGLSLEHRRSPAAFSAMPETCWSTMCSDSAARSSGSSLYAARMSEAACTARSSRFSMKTVTDGLGGWRCSSGPPDYGHALRDGNTLRDILGGRVVQRARLGKTYLPLVRRNRAAAMRLLITTATTTR